MTSVSVLQNGTSAALIMEPFPHMIIEPALPSELYVQLAIEYPEQSVIRQGGHESEFNCRYFAARALAERFLSSLWTWFLHYHTSLEFFREAIKLLEPALEKWYPERLDFIRRARTVPRGMGKGDIELEAQFVVNLPCEQPVLTTHLDNPRELYAILFYLRPEDDKSTGGDLEIYGRRAGSVRMHGRRKANPDDLSLAKTIPYDTNKAVLFLNTAVSFHGVNPYRAIERNRRYVNIIAEVSKRRDLLLRQKEKTWF